MLLKTLSAHDHGVRMRLEAFEFAYINTQDYWYLFEGDHYLNLVSVQYESILRTNLEEQEGEMTEDEIREDALRLGIRIDELALDMLDIIRIYRFAMPTLALNRTRRGGFSCNIRSKS